MCLKNKIEVLKNESLKNFCTFKIGGNAKIIFITHSTRQLNKVCIVCKIHNIKFKIIGLGANLLFDDCGFNGAIIVNRSNKIRFEKNCVFADSGVNLSSLILSCCNKNLGGIENLIGIPSTIGGAVVNGLGAFGVEFSNFVGYVECLNEFGQKIRLKNADCKFGYRTSIFKEKSYILLRVKLKLNFLNSKTIKQNMLICLNKKSATQPLENYSAGSVFKRFSIAKENELKNCISCNENEQFNNREFINNNLIKNVKLNEMNEKINAKSEIIPAKIIDELGLKGLKVGGAMVSKKHSGFIINTGNATSKDVKSLIDLINKKVKSVYGFTFPLELEIVK